MVGVLLSAEWKLPRSAEFSEFARGLAGWLLANPQFLGEHDGLFRRWVGAINDRAGRHEAPLLAELGMRPCVASDAAEKSFDDEVVKFLVRWRLLKLPGPQLPEPLKPMMGGKFPGSIIEQLMDAGGLFNIPDIFPIPSRDELRGMLQGALRSDNDSHLAQWQAIVHSQQP